MVADAKKWIGSDLVEIMIRIIVILTVIAALFLFFRQNSLSSCQSAYNQAYAEYSRSARDSRQADDQVRDELFRSLYATRSNPDTVAAQKQIDAAFVKYFTTVDLTTKQRKDNPPPPLPNDYCG
jgi:uncharacterized protein YxeA